MASPFSLDQDESDDHLRTTKTPELGPPDSVKRRYQMAQQMPSRPGAIGDDLEEVGRNRTVTDYDRPGGERTIQYGHNNTLKGLWDKGLVKTVQDQHNIYLQTLRLHVRWAITGTVVTAFLGLACGIAAAEMNLMEDIKHVDTSFQLVFILKMCSSGFTLLLLFFIYKLYSTNLALMRDKKEVGTRARLWSSPLWRPFLIETALCSVHSPYGLEDFNLTLYTGGTELKYPFDSVLTTFSLLRFYLLVRYCHKFIYTDKDNLLLRMYNVQDTHYFAIKTLTSNRPMAFMVIVGIGNCIVFGYMCRIAEIPGPNYWAYNFWQNIWLVLVTLSTVGYGDFAPKTHMGRFFCTMSFLVGNVIIALMIALVTDFIRLDSQQQKVVVVKKNADFRKLNLDLAVRVCTSALRFNARAKVLSRFVHQRQMNGDQGFSWKLIQLRWSMYRAQETMHHRISMYRVNRMRNNEFRSRVNGTDEMNKNAIVALQRNLIWLSDRVEACPLFEYYKEIQQEQQPKLFQLVSSLKDNAESAQMSKTQSNLQRHGTLPPIPNAEEVGQDGKVEYDQMSYSAYSDVDGKLEPALTDRSVPGHKEDASANASEANESSQPETAAPPPMPKPDVTELMKLTSEQLIHRILSTRNDVLTNLSSMEHSMTDIEVMSQGLHDVMSELKKPCVYSGKNIMIFQKSS